MKEKKIFSEISEEVKRLFQNNSNKDKSLKKKFKEFLKVAEEKHDINAIGTINYYLALLNYNLGYRTMVLPYALKSSSIFAQTEDYDMLARSYNILGIAYLAQENYQMALASYRMVYQTIANHKVKTITKDIINNNIAECYYQMGDYKKSSKMFEKCFSGAIKDQDYLGIGIYGINLSECYGEVKQFDKAIDVLNKIEEIVDKIDRGTIASGFYARYAVIAYAMNNIELGNKYADKTYEEVKETDDTYELHRDFEKIAHEQIKNHDYDRADKFAQILLDYSKSTGHTIDKIIAYRVQADYYKTIEDVNNAYKYYIVLNKLYIKQQHETNEMQLAIQKSIDKTNKEVIELVKAVKDKELASKLEPFTKLLNRKGLLEATNEFLNSAKSTGKKIGSIFIDIDFFKEYNDTYGHPKGDVIIKSIAQTCLKYETNRIKFARYGGDEFLGVILGAKDIEIETIAKSIAKDIKDLNLIHDASPFNRITLSIGIVNFKIVETENTTILDIINYSDKALYYSKKMGRNTIYKYAEENLDSEGKNDPYIKIKF